MHICHTYLLNTRVHTYTRLHIPCARSHAKHFCVPTQSVTEMGDGHISDKEDVRMILATHRSGGKQPPGPGPSRHAALNLRTGLRAYSDTLRARDMSPHR